MAVENETEDILGQNKRLKRQLEKAERERSKLKTSLDQSNQAKVALEKEIEKQRLDTDDIKKAEDLRNLQAIYDDLQKLERWTKTADFLCISVSFRIEYGYVHSLCQLKSPKMSTEGTIHQVEVERAHAFVAAFEEALAKQEQLDAISKRLDPLERVVNMAHGVLKKAAKE